MIELPKFNNPLEYIRDYLPVWLGVHKSYGVVAALIYNAEVAGFKEFAHDNFESLRDRAALGIPYQVKDIEKREHALALLQIIIATHRIKQHGENYMNIINDLLSKHEFTKEETKLIDIEGFWN